MALTSDTEKCKGGSMPPPGVQFMQLLARAVVARLKLRNRKEPVPENTEQDDAQSSDSTGGVLNVAHCHHSD
jgi:hypothetical protein